MAIEAHCVVRASGEGIFAIVVFGALALFPYQCQAQSREGEACRRRVFQICCWPAP